LHSFVLCSLSAGLFERSQFIEPLAKSPRSLGQAGSMTMDEQREELNKLDAEIEALGRSEESLVCAAFERGVDVLRRATADPACVLGVRLPPKPVAARPARRQRLAGPAEARAAE
jgi:hypothetical protein